MSIRLRVTSGQLALACAKLASASALSSEATPSDQDLVTSVRDALYTNGVGPEVTLDSFNDFFGR